MTNDCDDISTLFQSRCQIEMRLPASNVIFIVTTMTSSTGMQRTHVNDYKAIANDC